MECSICNSQARVRSRLHWCACIRMCTVWRVGTVQPGTEAPLEDLNLGSGGSGVCSTSAKWSAVSRPSSPLLTGMSTASDGSDTPNNTVGAPKRSMSTRNDGAVPRAAAKKTYGSHTCDGACRRDFQRWKNDRDGRHFTRVCDP